MDRQQTGRGGIGPLVVVIAIILIVGAIVLYAFAGAPKPAPYAPGSAAPASAAPASSAPMASSAPSYP